MKVKMISFILITAMLLPVFFGCGTVEEMPQIEVPVPDATPPPVDIAPPDHDTLPLIADFGTTISAHGSTIGLRTDGTVVAVGSNFVGRLDVCDWYDIVSVSAGSHHTVGLRSNGTVVAVGHDWAGNVSAWYDILAISAGAWHVVGLRSDGTVVAIGRDLFAHDTYALDVSDWSDVVAVSAGNGLTVGLRSDGRAVATKKGQLDLDVSGWQDMIAVSAGTSHIVGLRSDGRVVAVGDNLFGQLEVSDWRDIVAVSAGTYHTIGLKADGTVVITQVNIYHGQLTFGQQDVSDWQDIVAVSAGEWHTVGLRSDGTVVAVGWNNNGQLDVCDWRDIAMPLNHDSISQVQPWQEAYASILWDYKERYDYLHFSIHDIDLDGIPELFIIGYGIDTIYTFRYDNALRLEYGDGIYEIAIHLVAARTGITTMPNNQPGIITYGRGAGSPFGASVFLRKITIDGNRLIVDAFGSIIIDPQNGDTQHLINDIAVSETEFWQKFGHSQGQQYSETGSASPLPQSNTLTEANIQRIIFDR